MAHCLMTTINWRAVERFTGQSGNELGLALSSCSILTATESPVPTSKPNSARPTQRLSCDGLRAGSAVKQPSSNDLRTPFLVHLGRWAQANAKANYNYKDNN